MSAEPGLSVKDANGRQISLLNDAPPQEPQSNRRRYHCTEPGCKKSFTTSGHLARHNRIHTGEKNFYCLYPGCPSRFSRQDNMMQHYRTHMSSKSRRHPYQQYPYQPALVPETTTKILPQFHRHKHIRSDNEQNLRSLHQACLPSFQPYIIPSRLNKPTLPSLPPLPPPPTMNYQHRHQIDASRLNNDSNPPADEDSDLLQLAHIVSTFG